MTAAASGGGGAAARAQQGGTLYPRPPPALRVYSAAELAEATAGFHSTCLIGEGGFGKVYRAMVNLTPVAIKVLDHEGLQGLREFHNEMQMLAGIEHPSIVRLLGYAAQQPTPGVQGCQALVYELMTQGNLEEHLARRGGVLREGMALPWQIRVRVAAETACALAFLHGRGIIHRDIKPANVFLDADLHAKLGDIGLAVMDTLHTESPAATLRRRGGEQQQQEEAIGTWQYLAPEYMTQGRSSIRTDAYALGLTFLQLLSGAPKPAALVPRAQVALEECTLTTQFLDPAAGDWDVRIAEKMVKLSLWCCMHVPEHRPAITTVWAELGKLAQAVAPSIGAATHANINGA